MRFWMLVLVMGLLLGHGRWAQGQEKPSPEKTAASDAEPTLPPVIVRPEQSPEPAAPTTSDTPPTPGSTSSASPAGDSTPPPASPPDQSLSYPSLSQQAFGRGETTGLDSVTRGETSLFDLPAFGTIIDRQTIQERQAMDLFGALQTEVGVLMQQTARGQASPFIRGLTGQQILILVDGIRVNNSIFRNGPNQYFNLFDPGQVERIEIIRGPQSVLWGSDALGGVMNIVTRSAMPGANYGRTAFTEYFSTADSASYSRGNVEGWLDRGGVFGGASYLNVNDLDRGGDLGRQPFINYDQYAGDIKFNYLLGPDAMLTLGLQHFEQRGLPRSDRFAPFVYGPPAGSPRPSWYDPQQRDLAYLRVEGLASNGLFDAYSTTLSYTRNKEGSTEIRSTTRTDLGEFDVGTLGFSLALARDLDWAGRMTYGADWYYDDVDAVRNRLNPETGVVTPSNPQIPNDARYQRVGAFVNWDVAVTERLRATTGVRYENADASGTINAVQGTPVAFDRTYQDWIASVGLTYKVTPMFNVFGTISEGYRAPNLDDLTADNPILQNAQDVPSLNVQPEHAWTYEVGLKFDTPRLRFQISEYWVNLENNILRQAVDAQGNPVPDVVGPYGTLIPGSSNFIRANFDSFINGTELAGEYLLDHGWSLYGNFWYTYGQDLERDQPLSRIPPTQGVLGLRWREECNRRWLDVYTWMVARQDRYNPQNNVDARFPLGGTPGYATLNLRIGTALGRCNQHQLSLGLENITDKAYRVLGSGVDGPGFNATFGYGWCR